VEDDAEALPPPSMILACNAGRAELREGNAILVISWRKRMAVTYHVGPHDGGFGYRLGDVWSETYPDHDAALAAAKSAAQRQHLEGNDAEIMFQLADGRWQTEHADGGDRPETEVVDDTRSSK
jgi:hypothetical protein